MTPYNYAKQNRSRRKLSIWRLALCILVLLAIAAGIIFVPGWREARQAADSKKPWFAAYVDVTATPQFDFEEADHDVVLSFIVASKNDPCVPSWGGEYTLDQAGESLDLDRRIARLRQQGHDVAISFGGLNNDELAVACTDQDKLVKAYESVIERYNISTIDLDLENNGLTNKDASAARAQAIAKLQTTRRDQNDDLAVWVTLPATPQGLSQDGTEAIEQLLAAGVDLAGVNVMTMDYGDSRDDNATMSENSTKALIQTHRQLGILYQQADIWLSSSTLWQKIGATPMIGQNDIAEEIFTLDDAALLNQFAVSKGLGRMSMWSANRDVACGANYVNTKIVSDSCSGVNQEEAAFTDSLSRDFDGSLSGSAGVVTAQDSSLEDSQKPDDPAASPYQIWSETGTYLAGTKVVWHHNVYQAKWWTKGDTPDDPVLQIWETPWQLIGPVLPGEKPIAQATLPAGTYPEWAGETVYTSGQRILFEGVPYQAKWWNINESPAAVSSDADGSPWTPLTQKQINEIVLSK